MTCHINLNKRSALKRMHLYFRVFSFRLWKAKMVIDEYLVFNVFVLCVLLQLVGNYCRRLVFLVGKYNCICREKCKPFLLNKPID
jgi:hypothetical protein